MRMPANICSGFRFAIALCLAIVGNPLMAGNNESTEPGEAQSQPEIDYECSCSIRKRQQVEARMEKKKKSEQEQSELGEKLP
jgi:hypothetical protein